MDTTVRTTLVYFVWAGGIVTTGVVAAQSYPTKPIRLIVPFAPGGAPDIVARLLAQKFFETFKQAVVVDNRPGGGGMIGNETGVRANPDGYTMIMASGAYATSAALYKLPYDPVNDVDTIAVISEAAFIVTTHPSVPVASVKELIAYDKANPGKLNYGSSGSGGSNHLVTELFNQMAGTKLTHVPYKGAAPAAADLIAGQVDLMFNSISVFLAPAKAGKLRLIATAGSARSAVLPDLPTVAESGLPGFDAGTWHAFIGPAGMAPDSVALLSREFGRALNLPDVKEKIASMSLEPQGMTPAQLSATLQRDAAKWKRIVAEAGIKLD